MAIASEGSLSKKAKGLEIASSILGIFKLEPLIGGTVVTIAQVSGLVPWSG